MVANRPLRVDPFTYHRQLRYLREEVLQQLDHGWTVHEAARVAGVSPAHFSTFFRQRAECTFSAWLRVLRVRKAATLALTRDYTVAELAWGVGYQDTRAFQRAFRRHTGCTVTEFRTISEARQQETMRALRAATRGRSLGNSQV